jgi:predicted secreted hydrolase
MRRVILALAALFLVAAAPDYAVVKPGVTLQFPRDHGAHPGFRTEWWYATGWLTTEKGEKLGFQVTFFRIRPPVDQANPSAFAAKQVIFAHAALSDVKGKKLFHDQRIARSGFGLAGAKVGDTDVSVDGWRMVRGGDGQFRTRIDAGDFGLDLVLTPTQPVLPQGRGGYSQKGPAAAEASHYYSVPQLQVSGSIVRNKALGGAREAVSGKAWLDREWSSTLMNPKASGWDWLGLNMDDGGALTLFRMRDKQGAKLWAGGSYRDKAGVLTVFGPGDVVFSGGRTWVSPRTGARYPVAPAVRYRVGSDWRSIAVTPLFDDQELDSRRGGGPVYWEGAVTVPGGRGFLEMTGYQAPLKM